MTPDLITVNNVATFKITKQKKEGHNDGTGGGGMSLWFG